MSKLNRHDYPLIDEEIMSWHTIIYIVVNKPSINVVSPSSHLVDPPCGWSHLIPLGAPVTHPSINVASPSCESSWSVEPSDPSWGPCNSWAGQQATEHWGSAGQCPHRHMRPHLHLHLQTDIHIMDAVSSLTQETCRQRF